MSSLSALSGYRGRGVLLYINLQLIILFKLFRKKEFNKKFSLLTSMDAIKFYSRFLFKKITHSSGIKVDQILVFDESLTPISYCENAQKFLTIDQLREKLRIPEYRIEIRYSIHGKKFRAVIRNGDNVNFPIRKELGMFPRVRINKAYVLTVDGIKIDVTKRVLKYAGQNMDFNQHAGALIFTEDMFPFHDTDEYKSLIIETSNGDYEYTMHDLLILYNTRVYTQ
ncbi:hypothetical protein PBCVCVM1_733L [Paramecium bursaria Chlorella virus CVM-1]|nr:hypothetical protein PBCVCVM1_733L [Paramecium bursaria Chlorella virus CVM-1]AGE52279.1 hypothetical protein PBCVCVR1_732L [Paramecium bursaria Chlorella virus CVR-1]